MDVAQSAPSVATPTVHSITSGLAPTCPRLGGKRGRVPCSPTALLPVQDLHGAPTGWETSPHHHRSLASQSLHSSSSVPPGQPCHSGSGSPSASSHGGHRHFGGVYTYSHPFQSPPVPCLFVSEPTLLFSSSPLRSQCGTVHLHQGPGLAAPHPSPPGDQYPRLSRRYCPLAPLSSGPSTPCPSNPRETLCHGVPGQPPEVPTGTSAYSPMAGHPLAPTDGTLAGVPRHQGQNPVVYPPAPSHRPHHPQASRGPGGTDQLRLSGAQPFASLPTTADGWGDSGLPPRQRRLSSHTPSSPPCPSVLGGSPYLGLRPSVPDHPTPSSPLDRRLPRRMGRSPSPTCHGSRVLGATGGSPPHQCSGASGGPQGHFGLSPVVLPSRRVYGQRDGAIRSHTPPFSLSSITRRTQESSTRLDRATGISPPATHSHQPQCRCGRPQPPRAPEYGMDAASRSLLRDPSLGGSSSGGPPGLSDQSPSATVGVSFSSPGCSGLQLSQYRLERLRQHLRVSSSRSDSDPPATHPRLPRSPDPGGSMGLPGPVVAPPLTTGQRPPTSADDSVPVLRTRPGLPQVGDLRTLDRLSFLRRALLASRPAEVVNTLLACYRPSSQRQQEVAWTAFRHWLPRDRSSVTKDDVLAFLQYLFSARSLAPTTILNYRAALQWPLEEAFAVDFGHPDFSRFASGLFHLRPPTAPVVPQWNLSAVIRFYERVDSDACSFRLLLLKTLCLTALASGNRCSELAHISRRAIVDQGASITLPLIPRFLYKNQTASRCPPPISFPTFPNSSVCPVETLRVFLRRTATWHHRDFLFINPVSHASLVAGRINYWLVQAILAADVGNSVVRAHDVRKFAYSVNWARRADMSHILKHGFWASAHPFLHNYLTPLEGPLPGCVAAGSRV